MEKYNETDVEIKEAKDSYETFIADEAARMAQLRHEMYLHDVATEKAAAERNGMQQGRQSALIETARNMRAMGLPDDVIEKATGLSAEQYR
jgi:predicted transposase/invertase (TIGR01784 family)